MPIFLILAMIIFIGFIPNIAIASELEQNQVPSEEIATEIVEPQAPTITDDMTEEEANNLINDYNNKVDEYNKYAEEENAKRKEEYDTNVEEVTKHNEEEDIKVEENNKQLEKQEKLDKAKAADSVSKLVEQTTNSDNLPDSWVENTQEPKTMSVEKNDSTEQYKISNVHIYLDENFEDSDFPDVTDSNFYINDAVKEHMVLGEWETINTGNNDVVSIYSQGNLYPHSGALFVRRLEGYTNGYWIPTQFIASTAVNIEDSWNDGPITIVSYNDGTTDGAPLKNIINLYTYSFLRYGVEPTRVEKYNPNYLDYPEEQIYLAYLPKMDNIVRPPKTPEKVPEKEEEKTPEKDKEKTPEKDKEDPKEKEKIPEEENQKEENKEKIPVSTNEPTLIQAVKEVNSVNITSSQTESSKLNDTKEYKTSVMRIDEYAKAKTADESLNDWFLINFIFILSIGLLIYVSKRRKYELVQYIVEFTAGLVFSFLITKTFIVPFVFASVYLFVFFVFGFGESVLKRID